MKSAIEKSHEIILGEEGVQVTIRPMLPFVCEEFAVRGGTLQLIGAGVRLSLPIPAEQVAVLQLAETIQLIEFPVHGSEPAREIIVIASGSNLAI